jgi:hypothetical protein
MNNNNNKVVLNEGLVKNKNSFLKKKNKVDPIEPKYVVNKVIE